MSASVDRVMNRLQNQRTDSTGRSIVSECRLENDLVRGLRAISFNSQLPIIYVISADPDQTPRSVSSDLGLHCLAIHSPGFRYIPHYSSL